MPAPAMPTTMRGDGRGTLTRQAKPVGRYFAGKGEDVSAEEEEEEEEEETAKPDSERSKALASLDLKDVDLQRHYEQAARLEIEAAAAAQTRSDSEYETDASGDDDDDDDDESEEEEEEEEEEAPRRVLMRPTFISKTQRRDPESLTGPGTGPSTGFFGDAQSATTTKIAVDDGGLDEQQKRRLEARKLIEEQIRLEASHKSSLEQHHDDGADVDDTDGLDVEAEHAAWKLRELLRIKREREAIESREREREELEQRRAMPEAERMEQDLDRVAREREEKIAARREEREEAGVGGGGTTGKYHHRGGFFQDDPINKRRATGPIEETQAGAGLRGATKWNGLVNQDTSRDSIWNDGHNAKRYGSRTDEDENQRRKRRG